MTVAELIEELQNLPKNARVLLVDTEYGETYDVEGVELTRSGAVEIY